MKGWKVLISNERLLVFKFRLYLAYKINGCHRLPQIEQDYEWKAKFCSEQTIISELGIIIFL